ncbi:MAG: EboA domain-containing protein, partial [Ginsengibacter sp.]
MDSQTITTIKGLFAKIIENNVNRDANRWLIEKANQSIDTNDYQLKLTFTIIPRKMGKKEIVVKESDREQINILIPGFSMHHWTVDRLSRVWLLMQLKACEKEKFISRIANLFVEAEMNEQVAIYSSLPFLAYPEEWILRCSEGIRSNIGTVQEAIMYDNPYPSKYLDEAAWNQLVMKAFFAYMDVCRICGLDERANKNLA